MNVASLFTYLLVASWCMTFIETLKHDRAPNLDASSSEVSADGKFPVVFVYVSSFFQVETLREQETSFKISCKAERASLEEEMAAVRAQLQQDGGSQVALSAAESERLARLDEQQEMVEQRLAAQRAKLAELSRAILRMRRAADDYPSAEEVRQYTKHFVELAEQVVSTHRETKQFFDMYNSLETVRGFLEKETTLLNSIHDNFKTAMSSAAAKGDFLKQMQQIVETWQTNLRAAERRLEEQKTRRDETSASYFTLVEEERSYKKLLRDFQEECRRNDVMNEKLRALRGEESSWFAARPSTAMTLRRRLPR